MALTWDLGEIRDYEAVCFYEATADDPNHGVVAGDRVMNPVTNALIWACMAVDLPGIPRKDAAEFFARCRFVETLSGAFLIRAEVDGVRPSGTDAFITPEEVFAHIGLKANVSRMGRDTWLKKFGHDLDRWAYKVDALLDAEAAAVSGEM